MHLYNVVTIVNDLDNENERSITIQGVYCIISYDLVRIIYLCKPLYSK